MVFGAVPASVLAFPAGLGVRLGFVFSLTLKAVAVAMLFSRVFGWVGIVDAVGFALFKLFGEDIARRLTWFPLLLIVGPIWVASVHLGRYRKRGTGVEQGTSPHPAVSGGATHAKAGELAVSESVPQSPPVRLRRVLELMLFNEILASHRAGGPRPAAAGPVAFDGGDDVAGGRSGLGRLSEGGARGAAAAALSVSVATALPVAGSVPVVVSAT